MAMPRDFSERPLFPATPAAEITLTILRLVAGFILSAVLVVAVARLPAALVLGGAIVAAYLYYLAFVLVAGGARKAVTTLVHEAIHNTLTESEGFNRRFANLTTALLFTQPANLYRHEHVGLHHPRKTFTTLADVDCRVLVEIVGCEPGLPVAEAKKRLITALFRPCVHGRFLWGRIHGNLFDRQVPSARRFLALSLQLLALGIVGLACWSTASWLPAIIYTFGWILPTTIGYTQSAILQFASEHTWLYRQVPVAIGEADAGASNGREMLERGLVNRHVGTPWPQSTGRASHDFAAVLSWFVGMGTVAVFWRGFVLPGTLCVHGYHHLQPSGTAGGWPSQFFDNAKSQATGASRIPTYWAMCPVYEKVFTTLSHVPAQAAPTRSESFALIQSM
jgi:hypothetical protein